MNYDMHIAQLYTCTHLIAKLFVLENMYELSDI